MAQLKVGQTVQEDVVKIRTRTEDLCRLIDDLAQDQWTVIEAGASTSRVATVRNSEHFDADRFEVAVKSIDGVRYLFARRRQP